MYIVDFCKENNIPYIEFIWKETLNNKLKHGKDENEAMLTYKAKMKLASYRGYHFEDSAILNSYFANGQVQNR